MSTPARRNGVVVTLERIYDELLAVHEDVTVTKVHVEGLTGKAHEHDERISTLERARWPLPSLAVAVAMGALALSFWGRLEGS